jgi:hypothetical protein
MTKPSKPSESTERLMMLIGQFERALAGAIEANMPDRFTREHAIRLLAFCNTVQMSLVEGTAAKDNW